MATAQLNSFWNKAIGNTLFRLRLSATLVRKSCVTKAHNLQPDMEQDLANLMCHLKSTAKRSYFLQEKSKNAAKTSNTLRSVLRQSLEVENDKSEDEVLSEYFRPEMEDGKITLTLVREKKEIHPTLERCSDIQL